MNARKNRIKILLRESLLQEKLTEINQDVDFIYSKFFEESYEEINHTNNVTYLDTSTYEISTALLSSEKSVEAHNVNPCTIFINKFSTNHYRPSHNTLNISYPKGAYAFVVNNGSGNIKRAISHLSDERQKESLAREFQPETIKASIHHELVHWIDDSLNNNHIKKHIDGARETNATNSQANGHYLEIQAQIHNISQLKRKFENEWESLTFEKMISLSPALSYTYTKFTPENKIKWKKAIKQRMHREGLLGKNMINN